MIINMNACRDARPVRPPKTPCIYARILNETDARTVRPYMPLARKSACHSANPKVLYSMFNVQRQQILKFNVQNSKFKVQAPYIAVSVISHHETACFAAPYGLYRPGIKARFFQVLSWFGTFDTHLSAQKGRHRGRGSAMQRCNGRRARRKAGAKWR